jgi:hypothetical protein
VPTLRPHAAITPALLQHAAVHGYATAYWAATAIFAAGALLTALLYRSGRPDPADLTSTMPACGPRPRNHGRDAGPR